LCEALIHMLVQPVAETLIYLACDQLSKARAIADNRSISLVSFNKSA
jgi:hypothetical protein